MKEIVVTGKNAKAKVLKALTAITGARVERRPSEFEILKAVNAPKGDTMANQEMIDVLEKGLTDLEHEIDGLIAKRAKNDDGVEDDWSVAADNEDNDPEDDPELGGDSGDAADFDDDDEDDGDLDKIAKQTKFEMMARKIAADEDVPMDKAMSLARQRYPDLFRGFQAIDDTQKSYRSLVEAEIAKGCSVEVAVQRVAYAHPDLARSGIAKAQGSTAEFMAKVDETMQASGVSRTVAMQRVRKIHPALFKRYQNV